MVTVRPARDADAAAVLVLVALLSEAEHGEPPRLDAATLARDFLGPDPAGLLLVAEEAASGRLLGYATAHGTYESHHAERGCYVGDLFVRPEARRLGLGRALMAGVAAAARRRGAAHLWWTAQAGNQAAHAFYRRLGGRGEPVVAFACVTGDFHKLADEAEAAPPPAPGAGQGSGQGSGP
ncbi:GNAT family N-acetyltransferase [Roseomonas sp. NAR14]|uniref:GNAT family N-acetyltransferase n=1 Tax=Roseomonas acroporae TaxID=2937791 RepID=A0A9X1Y6F4_9PROT|nr:GNAT family N-acetyltransferase [Roseomonas acroporae]MCK8783095.1 GNAT family N-acetyltransferase [Roseomonas acroporae]